MSNLKSNSPCDVSGVKLSTFFTSSIGCKFLMALSGIILSGFIVMHMAANMLMYTGSESINAYAHQLKSMPLLLWFSRIVLLTAVLTHIMTSIKLNMLNKASRPVGYKHQKHLNSTVQSRFMMISGIFLLFFIIYHILQFTVGVTHPQYFDVADSTGRHDVYTMVVQHFNEISVVLIYVLAMTSLFFHITHGFASVVQTLGFGQSRWSTWIKTAAMILAIITSVLFATIPIFTFIGIIK